MLQTMNDRTVTGGAKPHEGRRHARVPSRLGDLLLVADGNHLVGVYFEGHRRPPHRSALGAEVSAADRVIAAAAVELDDYLAGTRTSFTVDVCTTGDAFDERVWALLRTIPYGATTTYKALAVELGDAALAQRVGQAVGDNPLSIVIPCHRVVGTDGSLTGYAGGLDRKRALLALEEPGATEAGRLF